MARKNKLGEDGTTRGTVSSSNSMERRGATGLITISRMLGRCLVEECRVSKIVGL